MVTNSSPNARQAVMGAHTLNADDKFAHRVVITNPSPEDAPGPTDIELNCLLTVGQDCAVNSGASVGSVIGTLVAINGEGPYVFSIEDDPDGVFDVSGNDLLVGGNIDFNVSQSHNLTMRVTDDNAKFFIKSFVIRVIAGVGFLNEKSITLNGTDQYGVAENNMPTNQQFGSISVWVKTTSIADHTIFCNVDLAANLNPQSGILFKKEDNDDFRLRLFRRNSNNEKNYTWTCPDVTDGNWHHILVTWQVNTSTVRLYQNGSLRAAVVVTNGVVNDIDHNQNDLYIGARLNSVNDEFWDGELDELSYHSALMTTSQAVQIFNSGNPINLLEGPVSANLGLWYRFEKIKSSIVVNEGSYTGMNLSMVGDPDLSMDPPKNKFNLFRTQYNGIDEYIRFGNAINSIFSQNSAWSISLWVEFNSVSSSRTIIGNRPSGSISLGGFEVALVDSLIRFGIYRNGGNELLEARADLTLAINTKYHVLITYDGSTTVNGIQIYINGIAQNKINTIDTIENDDDIVNTIQLQIARRDNSTQYMAGFLDELSLWSKALSGPEVSEIYNSGVPNDISQRSDFSQCVLYNRLGETFSGNTYVSVKGPNGTDVNMTSANRVAVNYGG